MDVDTVIVAIGNQSNPLIKQTTPEILTNKWGNFVVNEDGSIEVLTAPPDFLAVKDSLEKAGLKAEMAEVTMKPSTENVLAGDDALRMQKLLDALESLDDVQDVFTTAVIEE